MRKRPEQVSSKQYAVCSRQKAQKKRRNGETGKRRFLFTDSPFPRFTGSFFSLLLAASCLLLTVLYGCASSKKIEMPKAQAKAIEFNQRGVNAVEAGDYERALVEFKKSLSLNTSIDNQKGMAVNFLNLGRAYLLTDRFYKAEMSLRRAMEIGAALNEQFLISEANASLGCYYDLMGNNKEAADYLESAVSIDRKEGHRTIGNRLNMLATIYKEDNRMEEAEKIFNDALKAGKSYGIERDVADSLRGLGDIALTKKDYKRARELYENALSINKKIGTSTRIYLDLFSLGKLSIAEGDNLKAVELFLRAYAVADNRGNYRLALKAVDKLIELFGVMGDEANSKTYSFKREHLLQKVRPLEEEERMP